MIHLPKGNAMPTLKTASVFGFLVWIFGCGSGGGTKEGGSVQTGACDFPSCVSTLIGSCQPSGTCATQSDATLTTDNYCFSNGVTAVSHDDSASYGWTTTYKKNGATCYAVIEGDFYSTTSTFQIVDGSGAILGTGTSIIDTKAVRFACAGGAAITLNSGCDLTSITTAPLYKADCATGPCSP